MATASSLDCLPAMHTSNDLVTLPAMDTRSCFASLPATDITSGFASLQASATMSLPHLHPCQRDLMQGELNFQTGMLLLPFLFSRPQCESDTQTPPLLLYQLGLRHALNCIGSHHLCPAPCSTFPAHSCAPTCLRCVCVLRRGSFVELQLYNILCLRGDTKRSSTLP